MPRLPPREARVSARIRRDDLLALTPAGLACPLGGFHVDPWAPVPLAVLTHAHGDHATPGCGRYLCAAPGLAIARRRLGPEADLQPVPYGEPVPLGETTVSFHPSGHILGAAQVRIERAGEVLVVSGDYKREPDPTCPPWEVVPCDVFVTESTFALPIYRWPSPQDVAREIHGWWLDNARSGRTCVLTAYPLGKAQRLLVELARHTDQPVWLHGAVDVLLPAYRSAGVDLPPTQRVVDAAAGQSFAGALVLAPPGAESTPWIRRFGDCETAFASGWMRVRGNRRRRAVDRGFVLSDHADWPGLLQTIRESGARRVLATHGFGDVLARYLREVEGLDAQPLDARWQDEDEAPPTAAAADGTTDA